MLIPGLVSITFRKKSVAEICNLCAKAELKAVEWGGDVHVPDLDSAREARKLSRDAGLEICSYGSYYRVGEPVDGFLRCLDIAGELGTDLIRVWCGQKGSAETDERTRAKVVSSLAACCEAARVRGIRVAPEYHGGTLTDDIASVARLLVETRDIPNLLFYWQPRWDWLEEARLQSLKMLLPRIAHVHAFTWRHAGGIERLPLADGADMWKKALPMFGSAHILLEFVQNDCEEAFLEDARILRKWIAELR